MVLNCCKGITLERKKQIYWKEKGLFSRTTLDIDKERQSFMQDIEEYPPLDWEYEQNIIFHPK